MPPHREAYESIMRRWNLKKTEPAIYKQCLQLVADLWDYQATQPMPAEQLSDVSTEASAYYGPSRSTYLCLLQALMQCDDGRGREWISSEAQRLVDEMGQKAELYPQVKPNIVCVNVVL